MNLSSLDSLTELIGAAAIRSGAAFALDDIAGLDARARVMHVVRILHAISQTDPWIAKILNTQQAIPQLRAELLRRHPRNSFHPFSTISKRCRPGLPATGWVRICLLIANWRPRLAWIPTIHRRSNRQRWIPRARARRF